MDAELTDEAARWAYENQVACSQVVAGAPEALVVWLAARAPDLDETARLALARRVWRLVAAVNDGGIAVNQGASREDVSAALAASFPEVAPSVRDELLGRACFDWR